MPRTATKKTIDIFNKEEIEYWCKKLDCEKGELFETIFEVGKSVKDVKNFIAKKTGK